ncbi:MAG: NUDIX hydrolase [Clostridiales bacterium]|nr:NUDIX hydrolase [Clostridiales bacterium]
MKIIKEFDYKDYKVNGTVGIRPSVRAIIIRDGKLALVYNEKYDYYAFAGGGIEDHETREEALIREIREELGLNVIPASIKEYGLVVRKEKGSFDDLFIQENYYFMCEVSSDHIAQQLDDYEEAELYGLRWITAEEAIETNKTHDHSNQEDSECCERLIERQIWMMNRLISEGWFKQKS